MSRRINYAVLLLVGLWAICFAGAVGVFIYAVLTFAPSWLVGVFWAGAVLAGAVLVISNKRKS